MTKGGQEGGLGASVLDRLLDDDPRAGDPRIDSLDLKNPVQLGKKLQAAIDPLSRYIREQCDPGEVITFDGYDGSTPVPQVVLAAIVESLNRVIFGSFLYERERFLGIHLSAETVKLIEDSRKSKHVFLFNRLLLDEAYADELQKMRKPAAPALTIRELKASVSRDIEMLLNTRRELLDGVPSEYGQVQKSILMYGLPDVTSYSLANPQDQKVLRRSVEEALSNFEPRLRSVRVTLEPRDKYNPTLRFRIEALLRTDPAPEPITLDAALNVVTSQYSVRGDM
jgi:type VI secretion system protein ImpF